MTEAEIYSVRVEHYTSSWREAYLQRVMMEILQALAPNTYKFSLAW